MFTIEAIAILCHEINRIYCNSIGDTSQKSWSEAEEWQRESAIKRVEYKLANMQATPEDQHKAWCEHKWTDGWKYGPVKDAEKKEHPCLVPYSELPQEQRVIDELFVAIVTLGSMLLPKHVLRQYSPWKEMPLSEGEELVDVTFTSQRSDIAEMKEQFANVIDYVNHKLAVKSASNTDNQKYSKLNRLASMVKTNLEIGCMEAVKMITR